MLEKESSASDYMDYTEEQTVEALAESGLEPREIPGPSALLTATEVPPMQKLFSTTASRMKSRLYLPAPTVEGTELEPAFLKRNNVQQMFMMPSAVFLSGLAVVSDDICGSGNYSAEMNLNLGRELTPGDVIPPQGNLNVDINLKTNNSQIHLEIRSCCLSPTAQPDEINSTCCTFARLPLDSKDIRLLGGQSKRASFTIQLFQMINYSTAYLHCELGICLKNHTECETQCFKQRKLYTEQGAIQSLRRSGNLISFGPMLKRSAEPSQEQYGSTAMKRIIILLGCVLGGSLLTCTFLFVWLAHRRRATNASMFQLGFMEFA
ncbi:uromodulin-like 1 isoform X1 [Acipenser oxyrinchus oxyrinchus]|uniref:Uromodulin-like 1 isoform X1 n=1 Tax=Acipenser oxyrinchus oxyrinchus TaxID=40147 RepID=A0AAD8FP37_ACIOX|nr:uromodulin-like 1 isoform X1 [Acipenser oxyrinchus oxyrinchus]